MNATTTMSITTIVVFVVAGVIAVAATTYSTFHRQKLV